MTALTTGEIEDWYQNDIAPAEQPIFLTETQENGSYEIDDVPEGRYYLVIVAGQMDDGSADPLRTRSGEALSKYLPLWDQYAMFVIGMNSCVVQEIEITDGAMTRADYDFGEIIGSDEDKRGVRRKKPTKRRGFVGFFRLSAADGGFQRDAGHVIEGGFPFFR